MGHKYMAIVLKLLKLLAIVAAAGVCAWMTARWGPWRAMTVFAGAMAVLCIAMAVIVHRQPVGKVTLANYVMSYVLPWGYRVGKGQLVPIVLTSWFVWMLVGTAATLAVASRSSEMAPFADASSKPSTLVMTLLVASWIVDGALLLLCIQIFITSTQRDHVVQSLGLLALFLVAIIGGSIALVMLSHSTSAARYALMLAGGPPALVGVGYGLFVLVVVTAGRKARWN